MVIDSDRSIKERYRNYFRNFEHFELVAVCSTILELESYKGCSEADIILSELKLPQINGCAAIHYLKKRFPDKVVVVMSNDRSSESIRSAFREGARGYLTKPISKVRMHEALESVQEHGTIMSADVMKKVISMFQHKRFPTFTERENEVLRFLCNGATYKYIAEMLFVTPSAVNYHVQNIYMKLEVNCKSDALAKVRELNDAMPVHF